MNKVADHYSGESSLSQKIAGQFEQVGKPVSQLTLQDLASVDEFHVRGRKATLELVEKMGLTPQNRVLDIGSGLGGPARTVADATGCHVTGIDLTPAFCEAANTMSGWVGLEKKVSFQQADATDLPFDDGSFDAAMTIHVAMNIPAKDKVYSQARRVLKSGGIFAVYDILQGEGGEVLYPVPWAREPSISFLATGEEMEHLLSDAGFSIEEISDSTGESQLWFEKMKSRMDASGQPPVTFQAFLGDNFSQMAANQVRNLAERRIRTVTFICRVP